MQLRQESRKGINCEGNHIPENRAATVNITSTDSFAMFDFATSTSSKSQVLQFCATIHESTRFRSQPPHHLTLLLLKWHTYSPLHSPQGQSAPSRVSRFLLRLPSRLRLTPAPSRGFLPSLQRRGQHTQSPPQPQVAEGSSPAHEQAASASVETQISVAACPERVSKFAAEKARCT